LALDRRPFDDQPSNAYPSAMIPDELLWRYRQNEFTDEDVTRCTGLTVRAWRELIKLRAVRTLAETRGRSRIRLCDATALKRAAVIAALNETGLSLAVSGQIAFCLPFHSVLYEIVDPIRALRRSAGGTDAQSGLPPPVDQPRMHWFDANELAQPDPHADWLVDIYDGSFVGVRYQVQDDPVIFGNLREERASFVAWLPLHPRAQFERSAVAQLAQERLPIPNRFADFVADWEDPKKWSKELKQLGYEFAELPATDPLRASANLSIQSPVIVTTINVSLAIRKALRRYLGLEPGGVGPHYLAPR
jgi:hypothetical protein